MVNSWQSSELYRELAWHTIEGGPRRNVPNLRTLSYSLTLGLLLIFAQHARADFSYQQTSRITGGSMLNFLSMIGGRVTQAVTSTVSIKGDRMAYATPHMRSIVDVEAKTVTSLNLDRKTYSVMTFDEINAAMENPATADGATVTEFKMATKEGSDTKTVLDKETQEKIVTVAMTVAITRDKIVDTQMESHIYQAAEIEGARELKGFYKRMSGLQWSPGLQGLNNPEMNKALAGLFSKMREMDGLPLLSLTTVSGAIPGIPMDMSDLQNSSPSDQPAGGVLGGKLGALGAAMKRRSQNTDAAASSSGPLLELTSEVTNCSTKPVDPAIFQIPEGFSKTDPDGQPR